jgi:ABC-type amino acid transport substrate-binding protein
MRLQKWARAGASALVALALTATALGCGSDDAAEGGGDSTTGADGSSVALATVEDGVLTVGAEFAYKPLTYLENGEETGFDADLSRALAERMGLEVEFVNAPFDSLLTKLAAGDFDLVVSGFAVTEERQQVVDFSRNYFTFINSVAVADDDSEIVDEASLADRRVGVQTGTLFEEYATATWTSSDIVSFPDSESAITALRAGQVDAVFTDQVLIAAAAPDGGLKEAFAVREQPGEVGIAVNKSNPALLETVNTLLDEMIADGTYAEIYERYLGVPPEVDFLPGG